jgi:hypothetical protein
MLTTLSTVKIRLAIDLADSQLDPLLTNAIAAVSVRFDLECRRTLARAANVLYEFAAADTEIIVPCYPIESVARFELKATEAEGWVERPGVEYLIRRNCILSLAAPISAVCSPLPAFPIARVVYTGGYVLPGDPPLPAPSSPLPAALEQAAVEQVVYWFQNRDHLGVMRQWPKGGTYEQFADLDLLPGVRAVLSAYERLRI